MRALAVAPNALAPAPLLGRSTVLAACRLVVPAAHGAPIRGHLPLLRGSARVLALLRLDRHELGQHILGDVVGPDGGPVEKRIVNRDAPTGAEELKVTQYSGPTECDDVDTVIAGKEVGMHYTGTIDGSSATVRLHKWL